MVVVIYRWHFLVPNYYIQNPNLLLQPKAILLKNPQLLATVFPTHVVRSCGLVNRIDVLPKEKAFGLIAVCDS